MRISLGCETKPPKEEEEETNDHQMRWETFSNLVIWLKRQQLCYDHVSLSNKQICLAVDSGDEEKKKE